MTKLNFGFGNSKLSKKIATFSIPSGWTCPCAKFCLSKADRITGKISDGLFCKVRCFGANDECHYPNVRKLRWKNLDALQEAGGVSEMSNLIQVSLPNTDIVRVDTTGDFYNERYFLAWLNVALNNPHIIFYGYTKALPYLIKYKRHMPANFRFTASKGGIHDDLISKHRLKFAEIVFSVKEALEKGLPIDHTDSFALEAKQSFALLVHGTQPAGSEAAAAWRNLQKAGLGGYSKKRAPENKQIPEFKSLITIENGKIVISSQKPEQKELIYA